MYSVAPPSVRRERGGARAARGAARQVKSITLESVGGKPPASGGVACHGSSCTATLRSASPSAALSDEEGSAALNGACEPGQLPGMAYVVDTAASMSSADAAPVTSAASAVLSAAPRSSSRGNQRQVYVSSHVEKITVSGCYVPGRLRPKVCGCDSSPFDAPGSASCSGCLGGGCSDARRPMVGSTSSWAKK
jgi:hypothetical protein